MSANHTFRFRHGYRDEASSLGWRDYQAGIAYPSDYDEWSEHAQRNYENGRLRAANYKLACGRLPARQVSVTNYKERTRAVGFAIPRHHG